jgi:hypothetical protein
METKVGRVWVTSRPVQKERLENLLSVIAFGMKKLSYESQKSMCLELYLPKVEGWKDKEYIVKFIDKLLPLAYGLYEDRKFTGTPVFVKMIATALDVGDFDDPHKIDLFYLYDRIVERMMHIQERYKMKKDFTNASMHDDREKSEEISLKNLEKCSLLDTLPPELNPLRDEEIQSTRELFVERLQHRKDNIGIVMNVVENRPHFVHRTLAEYLTARWFSKNFESKKEILQNILFDTSYRIVKKMFDRILAQGHPLHCAVLNWDNEAVEILLEEGYDVNAVDKGGRTALHLIAAAECDRCTCEEITNSLLRHGASVDVRDEVLQWTALGYAEKTGNWRVLSRLSIKSVTQWNWCSLG